MAADRIIRVTGKGNIKVKPDVTRITMTLEGLYKEYDKTLKYSSRDTEILKDILEKHGFERKEVRTLSFNVDTRDESYQDNNGNWKRRFVGYEFRHVLKIEFDSDNDKLGKILYSLANARDIHPEFRISYIVKDKEAAKNELLGKAVTDARAKAEVLSLAAGTKLGQIKSIDYSWGEINLEYSPMGEKFLCAMQADETEGYSMDIEPDDIEVSDTVTVVWDIE